jgi:hypothetical protein
MAILKKYIDYRGLDGIARKLAGYEIIPYYFIISNFPGYSL